MSDLSYSLLELTGLGRQLHGLADALAGTTSATRWNPEEVGHRLVADALDDFAGSWDDKRNRLTTSLHSVGEMAAGSADTFRDVDDRLAAKVRQILEEK